MIHEKIKYHRIKRGMSQEELAVKLNVVRQTVSKWEKGLSVPDADMLMQLAGELEVSVSELLDISAPDGPSVSLAEELEKANEKLAAMAQRERQCKAAEKVRGKILFLTFAALIFLLAFQNAVLSVALTCLCVVAALVILYQNLGLLTNAPADGAGVLRTVTVISILLVAAMTVTAILMETGIAVLSERQVQLSAALLICAVMVFCGIVSPKLPFNRHIGLRLPWTVRDEETWNLAHRILGVLSLPLALLYLGCALTVPGFEMVTGAAMAAWIGIPGSISYLFFRKKYRGNP